MRILLIEDDGIIGEAVRDHTAAASHAVDWVQSLADGKAALEVVRYGLILLDLQLPDGNGIGLLETLRAGGDHTPVIILTARDQPSSSKMLPHCPGTWFGHRLILG